MTNSSDNPKKRYWFIPLIFSFIGLFYLFYPVVSKVTEVLDMGLARDIFFPINLLVFALVYGMPGVSSLPDSISRYMPDILFSILSLLYGIYVFRAQFTAKITPLQKRFVYLPLVALVVFWVLLLPLGPGYTDRNIKSLLLGGKIRVFLAGGSEVLRRDALWLVNNASSGTPPRSEWPDSLQKLGYWVSINSEKQWVEIELGSMCGMCASLGFMIKTDEDAQLSQDQIEELSNPNLLTDGIYFLVR